MQHIFRLYGKIESVINILFQYGGEKELDNIRKLNSMVSFFYLRKMKTFNFRDKS